MQEACPYCGEEKSALKNHVRLSSGGGHGPSGSYPDDFEAGGSAEPPPQSDGGQQLMEPPEEEAQEVVETEPVQDVPEDAPDDQEDAGGLRFEEDEFDEMVTSIEQEAHERGYEEGVDHGYDAGYGTAENELVPAEPDEPEVLDTQPVGGGCPVCGGSLVDGEAGMTWFGAGGEVLGFEEGDRICEQCDVLVETDGSIHWGSESSEAESRTCPECGEQAAHAEHAKVILGGWFNNTFGLRVFKRNRYKTIYSNIEEGGYNWVCLSCWHASY